MESRRDDRSARIRNVALAKLAARQHGVVSRAQLIEIGFDSQSISRGLTSGRLHRVHRGVYAVGHANLSEHGRWLGATLRAGSGAALSHLAAASLWGAWRYVCRGIDVVSTRQMRTTVDFRLHRVPELPSIEVTSRSGIPVTTFSRTVIDLVDIQIPHQIAHVLHEGAYRGILDLAELEATIERHKGRRGIQRARDAVALHRQGSAGTRSSVEVRALRLLEGAGLPRAVLNEDVETPLGPVNVDLYWADAKLCVELDGPGHGRPHNIREDARRDFKLTSSGHKVMRFSAADLWRNPRHVLRGIQAAHRQCLSEIL